MLGNALFSRAHSLDDLRLEKTFHFCVSVCVCTPILILATDGAQNTYSTSKGGHFWEARTLPIQSISEPFVTC